MVDASQRQLYRAGMCWLSLPQALIAQLPGSKVAVAAVYIIACTPAGIAAVSFLLTHSLTEEKPRVANIHHWRIGYWSI